MSKILKSIKEGSFWNWAAKNTTAVLTTILVIVFMAVITIHTAVINSKHTTAVKTIVGKAKSVAEKQALAIDSLTEQRSTLQKKVKSLKEVKMREKDSIKSYILTYYKTVAPVIAEEMAIHIIEKSSDYNVPLVTVIAVTEVESHFNPFAISKKGARGPMQVMPKYWLKEFKLQNKYALHDIETNITCGVKILRKYLDATDNDMRKALYKYVGGDNLYIKRVYESMGKFIVFKSFTDIKVSGNEEEDEVARNNEEDKVVASDNDKIAADLENTPAKVKPSIAFTHIVKKGQMLGQLAIHYTGSLHNWIKISAANPTIIPDKMPIGSVITIPTELLKNTTPLI